MAALGRLALDLGERSRLALLLGLRPLLRRRPEAHRLELCELLLEQACLGQRGGRAAEQGDLQPQLRVLALELRDGGLEQNGSLFEGVEIGDVTYS